MLWLFGIVIPLVIVVGSIMGMTAHGRISRLEAEVKALSARLSGADNRPKGSFVTAKPINTAAPISQSERPAAAEFTAKKTKAKSVESKPAPKAAPAKLSTPQKSKKPKNSLEETIGAQWSVWVGGLALTLGALFLLRFTLEAGVFTPAMRIALAAVLGAALLAAGEWMRRKDGDLDALPEALKAVTQKAYIPGVLTAIGILALLGASYAAYGLYNFIGPLTAFALLGAISLGGLFLGVLHGPKIAGLGLAAALVTPLLITTQTPQYFALFTYLLIVGCSALILARLREWEWLKSFALFGLLVWGFISIPATQQTPSFIAWCLYLGLAFLAILWIALKREDVPVSKVQETLGKRYNVWIALAWTLGAAALLLFVAGINDFKALQYGAALASGIGLMGMALYSARLRWFGLIGAGLSCLATISFALTHSDEITLHMSVIACVIATIGIILLSGYRQVLHAKMPQSIIWAIMCTVLPLTLALSFSLDYSAHVQSAIFAGLVIAFAVCAEGLWRRADSRIYCLSAFVIAAGAAYIGAVDTAFSGQYQSLAFMGAIVICAGLYRVRPIWVLRPLTACFAGLSLAHILCTHVLAGHIGAAIIFNQLWLYLALPAALSAGAAWQLSRTGDDLWSEGMKAFALTFTALFCVFQIHHLMQGGVVNKKRVGFDELALQVLVGFSVSLGGSLVGGRRKLSKASAPHERLIPYLAAGVSCFSLAIFGFGICLTLNPLINSFTTISEGLILNSLLLAYLLPAITLGAVAYMSRGTRPLWYQRLTGGLSLFSLMIYITAMIRMGFNGKDISVFENWPADAEMYTISAVWLAVGIALFALGIRAKQIDLRSASAAVIVLTVLKAFLIDMSSLEGMLRAMSFVVLGVVLIVIGRIYQKFLVSEGKKTP